MPLLGYGGYLPFAMELFAMYHLLVGVLGKRNQDYVQLGQAIDPGDEERTSLLSCMVSISGTNPYQQERFASRALGRGCSHRLIHGRVLSSAAAPPATPAGRDPH